jgi:hypothetical protein
VSASTIGTTVFVPVLKVMNTEIGAKTTDWRNITNRLVATPRPTRSSRWKNSSGFWKKTQVGVPEKPGIAAAAATYLGQLGIAHREAIGKGLRVPGSEKQNTTKSLSSRRREYVSGVVDREPLGRGIAISVLTISSYFGHRLLTLRLADVRCWRQDKVPRFPEIAGQKNFCDANQRLPLLRHDARPVEGKVVRLVHLHPRE